MEKISAIIICMKEEGNIRQCLESLNFVDEIVVIDSGVTNRTLEICKKFTDRIIYHPWPSYSQQMNFAIDQVKNEWILSVDINEMVSSELKKNILNALANDQGKYAGYRISCQNFYLCRWMKHNWYPDYKIRLFKKSDLRWAGGNPYNTIVNIDGKYRDLKGDLRHYLYREISQHIQAIDSFSSIKANEEFKKGKSPHLFGLIFSPLFRFFKLYILKAGFLDGMPGFITAVLESYNYFLNHAKLWEMNNEISVSIFSWPLISRPRLN